MKSVRMRIAGAMLLVVCLYAAACGQDKGAAASSAQAIPQVEVTTVKSQTLAAVERMPAELMPYESVDIYAKESGFVKSISVDRGSRVKQGERLAELEAPELVARRAQANAAYESLESQLAGAEAKLSADQATFQHMTAAAKVPGAVAANDLNIAEKTARADEANVEALGKSADAAKEAVRAIAQLESYLNITAPFDGQITDRYVHPGALVGPAGGAGVATPILRIETLRRHRLIVPVPENDVAGVPEGTKVDFTVPAFPGRIFHAPIARIAHEVDVKTRTMSVELDVADPHAELVPGTFCEVEWPVRRTYPTLFVPVSSVASNLERTFVVRIGNRRVEWVDVKTGVTAGGWIEAFGDLHAGEEVAVRGTDQLRPGTEVEPVGSK